MSPCTPGGRIAGPPLVFGVMMQMARWIRSWHSGVAAALAFGTLSMSAAVGVAGAQTPAARPLSTALNGVKPPGGGFRPMPVTATRFVAFEPYAGRVTVRDTGTGLQRSYGVDPTCRAASLASGRVLICNQLLLISSGTMMPVPNLQPHDQLSSLGLYWASGTNCPGMFRCGVLYVNWRTGERRSVAFSSPRPADTSSPNLTAPRPPTPNEPRIMFSRRSLVFVQGQQRTLLSRCLIPGGCVNESFRAGLITWSEGRIVRGYVTATRQRYIWRFPSYPSVQVSATPYEIVFSAQRPAGNPRWQLFVARRPRS